MYYRTLTTLKGSYNRSLPAFHVLFIPLKGNNGQYNYKVPNLAAMMNDEELMQNAWLIYIEELGCWYGTDLLEQIQQEEVTITFTL